MTPKLQVSLKRDGQTETFDNFFLFGINRHEGLTEVEYADLNAIEKLSVACHLIMTSERILEAIKESLSLDPRIDLEIVAKKIVETEMQDQMIMLQGILDDIQENPSNYIPPYKQN